MSDSRRRDVLDTHRAVGGEPDDLVEEIAEFGDGGSGDAQEPKLLGPRQRAVLEEDDSRMHVASAGQLQEVPYVRRDEDAIFVVGPLEDLGVGRGKQAAIAHVASVEPVDASELLGDLRRDVLIEEQLHEVDRREGTPP